MTLPVSKARTQLFLEYCHFIFPALVTLKPLVALTIHFFTHSMIISVPTQTDTQTKYRNPHCTCAPRVNESAKPLAHVSLMMPIMGTHTDVEYNRSMLSWSMGCELSCEVHVVGDFFIFGTVRRICACVMLRTALKF